MKKIIPKPVNWQDFESLCKKLYGEIWQCQSTISKNGRNGQSQNGVDIYGIPKGENEYFGIQCKGKDDYAKTELTEAEIDNEIENAKKFQPKLKQFIIATTGNKDAKIEEFVRKKNVDSRANGGFEIVVRHWEDLADLIEENQVTFDWYVSGKQLGKPLI